MLKMSANHLFEIYSDKDFEGKVLSVFDYQYHSNKLYQQFVSNLKIDVKGIKSIDKIPFLPISFFRTHKVIIENNYLPVSQVLFLSSGTTGQEQSKHFVTDLSIYEKSYSRAFQLFYGNIEDYCILALLPSYLEREGSSLIYMVDDLIKKSKHKESGFYLNNYEEILDKLLKLEKANQKVILLGVSYALLDIVEVIAQKYQSLKLKNTIIMETGGMKGKRKEMLKEEFHDILCKGFGVPAIHSEYGMTELLSQAYSSGNGIFSAPPWMRVLIRDTNDPFNIIGCGKTGGINVIDLANVNSCSFIATQDLGKLHLNNTFEVLGRFDNSDIRGCNLLIQ